MGVDYFISISILVVPAFIVKEERGWAAAGPAERRPEVWRDSAPRAAQRRNAENSTRMGTSATEQHSG